jgi:hypothetical protein
MSGFRIASAVITLSLVGCTETPVPQVETSSEVPVLRPLPDDPAAPGPAPQIDPPSEFAPLSLNGSGGTEQSGASMASDASLAGEASRQSIMKNLKPLQVMLGNWRGTTRKEYGDSKAVDLHEWIWDLQTDRKQPALVLKSDKSPYLQIARLTWVADIAKFSLTATNSDGATREYVGDYTDPVHEIVGPDDKMHRVFRLELTQTEESAKQEGGETWQVAFSQQENNRYLLEIDKRRGKAAFRRYDTVSTQREGTSFALSDSDYGDKTCIISQGLGTIAVSHKGKTFWVCCSGCKAAFDAEPEVWIARAEQRAAEEK